MDAVVNRNIINMIYIIYIYDMVVYKNVSLELFTAQPDHFVFSY
jgi:hypothetical protein